MTIAALDPNSPIPEDLLTAANSLIVMSSNQANSTSNKKENEKLLISI